MKKILFATTALVATTGMAAAEVTFGGYGRFGLLYVEGAPNETSITSRYRLQIDATAESDGGVQMGARVRIQQDNDDAVDILDLGAPNSAPGGAFRTDRLGTGINGVRFFARAGGFEVGVGNIFGALESMPGQYPIDIGLTGHSYEYTAYNFRGDAYDSDETGGAGFNSVEVMYSVGDFSVHASASDINDRRALHAAYTFSGWTAAIGFQDSDAASDTDVTVTIGGDIGPAFVNLSWADNGTGGDQIVLAGRFDVGASTNIEAYFVDRSGATDTVNGDGWGIDFNHDLGGGTSIRGGISETIGGTTLADLGVRFNF